MSSKKPKIPAQQAQAPTPRPFDEASLEVFRRDKARDLTKKKRGYQSTVLTGGINDRLGA